MHFVDSKGRLFGIINLIDLFVIVLILAFFAAVALNFVSNPKMKKTRVDIELKTLIRKVPREVLKSQQVLQKGDVILAGNAVVEKVLEVRQRLLLNGNESGLCDVIVLIKAKCSKLYGEYYCANSAIKVNSPLYISSATYIFPDSIILSFREMENG